MSAPTAAPPAVANRPSPQEIVEYALGLGGGDDERVVIVGERSAVNLRFAANSLTTNGQMSSQSVTVVAVRAGADGRRAGAISRPCTTLAEVAALVRDAQAKAADAEVADDGAELVSDYAHGDDWAAAPAATSIAVFGTLAAALGRAFAAAEERAELLYGFAQHVVVTTYLGTSTGLRRRWVQPTGVLELNGKSRDLSRSAWHGVATVDFTDVDVPAVVAGVSQRLDWARTKIELPAGRYETLLPPSAVADLMLSVYFASAARDAEEGRSVWSDPNGPRGTKLGQVVSALPIRLWSDPAADAVVAAPFAVADVSFGAMLSVFDNGAPISAVDWISEGRLAELIRNRAWAQKTGASARPFIDNLLLDGGGTASLEEMIASTERGLLLTCLWYIREVDPQTLLLTGLTRDGVYLIENGVVQGAVTNFRFNESPVGMLTRVAEAGRPVKTLPREGNEWFTRTVMPPLRVRGFNMSTVSDAS